MYNLNINKSSIVPTNLIVGRVLDKPFDTIQFKIHDGLDVMDLTGCTLEFRGTTPDNKKVTSNAIKILDAKSGEIEFTFPPNFYSAKGHFQNAYFVIKKGTNSESTNDLLITVLNAVDFNLDDAPIIIDQLDDLIQAVIDDLNNQLSKVKGDIKQTQDNITTLKKDVDAYKGQFNTELARMQKQLDDLAKAINQTDIQRPQITLPMGKSKDVWTGSFDLLNNIKSLGAGLHTVYATSSNSQMPVNSAVYMCIVQIHDIGSESKYIGFGRITAYSTYDGSTYVQTIRDNALKGWVRLDGQVPKITQDNGNQFTTLDDKNKSSLELLLSLPNGVQSVYLRTATDLPDGQRLIGINQKINAGIDSQFTGVAVGDGNTYSITYSTGTIRYGWKRLDGQVQKITLDNGGQKQLDASDTLTTLEALKRFGTGVHFVYINRLKDTPESYIKGLLMYQGGNELLFYGQSMIGNRGTYSFNGMKSEWKRLDNVTPPNVTTTQNGLMLSTDKVKLDGLEKYSDVTQSKSGLMSSTDKVKLDGFNSDYKVVMKEYAFLNSIQTYTWDASDLKEELVLVLSRYDTTTNEPADDMFTTEIIPRKHIELFEGRNYRLNLYGNKTKVIYPSLTKITGNDINGQGTNREFVIRAILVK